MEQSAVEYLIENLIFFYSKNWDAIVDQAKEIEKQQKGYSEEEVENIIQKLMDDVHRGDICYGDNVIDFKLSPRQWFEQFKNK